jgi:hypothetical protein
MRERRNGPVRGQAEMPSQTDIEREIQATLRSFETEPRLADDPGFYAALRRRIQAEEAAVRPSFLLSFRRHVLVPALLALMVEIGRASCRERVS